MTLTTLIEARFCEEVMTWSRHPSETWEDNQSQLARPWRNRLSVARSQALTLEAQVGLVQRVDIFAAQRSHVLAPSILRV